MNKRERLEKAIAGEKTDRIPVALWRHFPGDDQHPENLAYAVVDYQKRWDWDFVKVTPASGYCLIDYGVEDKWEGNIEGTRTYTKRVVQNPEDWANLQKLDPKTGALGAQLEALRLIREGVGGDIPVIHTIFNPISQTKNLAGADLMLEYLKNHPDALKAGLEIITENMIRYLDVLRESPIDGIFYAIQHASTDILTETQYREFGAAYDRRILEAIPDKWWFNMLHLHGTSPMLDFVSDYPVQAINWHDRETMPGLAEGKQKFTGIVSGGLGRWDVLRGTPDSVRAQAEDAIQQTEGTRFMLSTGCVQFIPTPVSNIRAVREVVEKAV